MPDTTNVLQCQVSSVYFQVTDPGHRSLVSRIFDMGRLAAVLGMSPSATCHADGHIRVIPASTFLMALVQVAVLLLKNLFYWGFIMVCKKCRCDPYKFQLGSLNLWAYKL